MNRPSCDQSVTVCRFGDSVTRSSPPAPSDEIRNILTGVPDENQKGASVRRPDGADVKPPAGGEAAGDATPYLQQPDVRVTAGMDGGDTRAIRRDSGRHVGFRLAQDSDLSSFAVKPFELPQRNERTVEQHSVSGARHADMIRQRTRFADQLDLTSLELLSE
jgi:hypothetical protein